MFEVQLGAFEGPAFWMLAGVQSKRGRFRRLARPFLRTVCVQSAYRNSGNYGGPLVIHDTSRLIIAVIPRSTAEDGGMALEHGPAWPPKRSYRKSRTGAYGSCRGCMWLANATAGVLMITGGIVMCVTGW